MGLLDTIRSMLGLDGDGSDRGGRAERRSTDVRVEHDPDRTGEPPTVDAESEAAVKGTDDSPEHGTEASAAAGTDATASTGSMAEEPDDAAGSAEPAEATGVTEHAGTETEAAEPAEAAGPTPDEPDAGVDEGTDVEDADGTTGDTGATGTTGTDEAAADESGPGEESVRVISGIGQAYGKRLADAGVGTVADLADADAADLADASGVSEKRIAGWQESARERLE